jgi:hypothetical protein
MGPFQGKPFDRMVPELKPYKSLGYASSLLIHGPKWPKKHRQG